MITFVLESLNEPFFYLGIAAVLAALLVPFLVLRRKELFLDVVCEAKLFGPEDNDSGHSTALSNAAGRRDDEERILFVINLHSAGRQDSRDIAPEQQYQRGISFDFGEGACILEAGVLEERPHAVGAKVHIDGPREDEVVIGEVLSERGDSIRLKALVQKPGAEPDSPWVGGGARYVVRAEGSSTGIGNIRRRWDSQKLLVYAFLAVLLGVVLDYSAVGGVGGLLTGDRSWLSGPPALLLGAQVTFVGIAAILLILALLKAQRSREVADQLGSSYPIAERKPNRG